MAESPLCLAPTDLLSKRTSTAWLIFPFLLILIQTADRKAPAPVDKLAVTTEWPNLPAFLPNNGN